MTSRLRATLVTAGAWAVCAAIGLAPDVFAQAGGQGAPAADSASAMAGDAARGAALFAANGCFDCHRIGDRGSRVGPDLSDMGQLRKPDQLERALVAPDQEVLPEHRAVRFVTPNGTVVSGRLLNQDAFSVQLITGKEELKSYPRAGLREFAILDTGLMPSVQGKLSQQQVADLVAYLLTLKRTI
jgi:putative heme-binding domain-containing protein